MYFTFAFVRGTETVFEGTAPVRGRTARYDSLVFSLSQNDATVTVTVEPEENGEGGEDNARNAVFEGEYTME